MPRNVEIKAYVRNVEELHANAKDLSKSEPIVIYQEDHFIKCPNGRLKLRKIKGVKEELIYYKRSDQSGPKLSNYVKVDGNEGELSGPLFDLLSQAYGIKGKVVKQRTLYMIGQTRVHVDKVENLGDFMELEVVLTDEQSVKEGENIAKDLMSKLKINCDQLIEKAYVDLLLEKIEN